ncbi:flagellar biosynthesis protein FlhF [Criibacterium bergeronii]|uniref:Flagellar biosynthesis protein FlhF n=1 Tax=Criibacterium bergeronii TaxID=1871336 RepID=A0A371IMJ9_9FIRM|nr:flagellar biosynthesis protein FlhF [Criibacterium bergeronii]MBS6062374.1 flagellar biosynthesis protein FlhF [Peptostreptococcaceae bacterium]RDY21722.1 flagellar biosynthesis protein FlhF [Criibacterium bergeronii]
MQVKKFIGESIPQVMAQIRKEFGNDAIILQTNKVKKGGFFGFFSKEQVEILAASDAANRTTKKTEKVSTSQNIASNDFKAHLDKLNEVSRIQKKQPITDEVNLENKYKKTPTQSIEKQNTENIHNQAKVVQELDEMKHTLNKLSSKINEAFKTEEEEKTEIELKENIKKLVDLGVSEVFSAKIINSITQKNQKVNFETVKNEIKSQFSAIDFDEHTDYSKNVIFVGSTGVGKTTTLAKIASKNMIENKNKIGFLTLDTYRISAVEQLKTYADILSSPIEVAYEINDISTAMDRLSNRDRIYIDTAGRSHHNKKQMAELKEIIDIIEDKTVYLVISANINLNDIIDIIKMYEFLEEYGIIVTKLDETLSSGSVLDIINLTQKNISYITFGQNVPDDMEKFDIDMYLTELLKETFR